MIAGSAGGLTGFWCTDGYAVCGYAEAAATIKDIVVSMDNVGVSKTPGLRVNAPPSARADSTFHGLFRSKAAWLELQPLDAQRLEHRGAAAPGLPAGECSGMMPGAVAFARSRAAST